jgi:superoxide reductase
MDRRSFIRFGIVGTTTGIIAPKAVLGASNSGGLNSNMAGGVYHTKDAPGRWAKKAGLHLPMISKSAGTGGKTTIQVLTGHPMKPDYDHYIVKHMLLDSNFNFIAEHIFNPTKDKQPISEFSITQHGPIYAMSVCNLHDSWLDVIDV